ncbi:MAG: response regulator transcription factor [Candidatus Rokubacteria bacterium]|nr:response regulator transcription factor [Candidatus Rokubacteria bacterium]
MIRVVIADDHHLVREGIRALLEKADDIEVVGEAADGEEAIAHVERLVPDVVVMDIAMLRLNGLQALERVRALGVATQVVMLSMYSDDAVVRQALQHGAKGYVLKGSVSEELLLAIRAASRGATYLSPTVSDTILGDVSGSPSGARAPSAVEQLTPREQEILQCITRGFTNGKIAEAMGISIKTVERHRTNLMAKLDAHNLVELIRVAVKQRLIRLEE